MSEKQFTIVGEEYVGYMQGNAYIISNRECKFSLWERKEDAQKVCDYLNELAEENEQLKQKLENIGLHEKNDIVKMVDGKVFIRM